MRFERAEVIDDSLNAFHYVDDALHAVGKERADSVSVFRYSADGAEAMGATTVVGVDGPTLLKAFADTWHAPAVFNRWTRVLGGSTAWELADRGGNWTVVYRRGDVVYLASAHDPSTLDAILVDMPSPGE